MNAGRALFRPRRPRREQRFRQRAARGPDDAIANETGETAVLVKASVADPFEPRHGTPAVDDQHGRAPLHAVDERAQIVLGLGYTGLFHKAIIALSDGPFKRLAWRRFGRGDATPLLARARVAAQRLGALIGDDRDHDQTGDRIGPPQARQGIQHEADE